MTDLDDKLLEQQEQERKQFKDDSDSHDDDEEEDFSDAEGICNEILEREAGQADLQDSDKKEKEDDGAGSGKVQSAADILVQLAIENAKLLFKDQYGSSFAQIHIADHDEIIRVDGSKFKRYLARLFYNKHGNKVVNAESIINSIQVLQAKAEYDGPTIPLSLRVAWHNENIYYDLSNDKWQCVKISQEGWEIVNCTLSPIFVRYNQIPQTNPERNYEGDIFDQFLQLANLKEDQDRILLKVYIISLFIPDIAHAMLILHGEKGSAKSTLQTMIKLIADPAKPTLLTIHNDRSEFIQQLAHNHIAYYDNVKHTPGWLSDESCKAVTGIGQSKRKLYTDDDEIVYEYKRCLGFNGINISLSEPDALDRSLMIELDRISKENRKVESGIIGEFIRLRPQLLGFIFNTLVKTLQIKSAIRLNHLPRMADFALWGEAIARALGYGELEFISAYYDNIGRQNIEAIDAHPLGQAVVKFFEEADDEGILEGSPLEILEQLEIVAEQKKINKNHRLWPKSHNALTRRLNQIRSNLLEGLGIEVTITRVTKSVKGKVNTSSIKIRKISLINPIPSVEQNHEGNLDYFVGGFLNSGSIISPPAKMPPRRCRDNRAQNSAIGDTGGIGDIFSTEGKERVSGCQDR